MPASGADAREEDPKLRSVVAATDLSERGGDALRIGAALARKAGARFEVVSVAEIPPAAEYAVLLDRDPTRLLRSFWRSTWQRAERQARESDASTGIPPRVRIGAPAQSIAEEAQGLKADLLVVGAYPHTGLARLLVRSTVEKLVRCTPCPLLATPPGEHGPFRRILAAIDLSIRSYAVLERAAAVALVEGAELRVLHVEDPATSLLLALKVRGRRRSGQRARVHLREIVEVAGLPSGLKIDLRVRRGRVGRTILDEAAGWDADLIALGSQGYGWLRRTILGSVSLKVLRRANRATLIVPGGKGLGRAGEEPGNGSVIPDERRRRRPAR